MKAYAAIGALELGYVIGHSVGGKRATIRRDNKSSFGTDSDEIDANTFAAELLMPEELVHHVIQKYLKKENIEPEILVSSLATEFEVSPEAMQYRLTNLGMFIPQ